LQPHWIANKGLKLVDAVPGEGIAASSAFAGFIATRRQYEYVSGRKLDFRRSDLLPSRERKEFLIPT
jgi:hypothetical protein